MKMKTKKAAARIGILVLCLLPPGGEYLLLDLDGDEVSELLLRWDGPQGYAVYHYADGQVHIWQLDLFETYLYDVPLRDGAMVRCNEWCGNECYTLFRYRSDGSEERLGSLAGIHWRNSDDNPEPPYYLIDDETVDEEMFRAAVQEQITDRRFDDADWSPIPADSEEKLRQAFSAWERANGYWEEKTGKRGCASPFCSSFLFLPCAEGEIAFEHQARGDRVHGLFALLGVLAACHEDIMRVHGRAPLVP